jgi:hypothetical protein
MDQARKDLSLTVNRNSTPRLYGIKAISETDPYLHSSVGPCTSFAVGSTLFKFAFKFLNFVQHFNSNIIMFSTSKFVVLAATLVSAALAAPTAPLSARAGAPLIKPIHPSVDANKCVGIVGGTFADGTLADV